MQHTGLNFFNSRADTGTIVIFDRCSGKCCLMKKGPRRVPAEPFNVLLNNQLRCPVAAKCLCGVAVANRGFFTFDE